jgi:DNA polymerase-1
MPLVQVLVDMERRGVLLDTEYLQSLAEKLRKRLNELERQIQDEIGYQFNVNSTQQLSDALFGKLGLPTRGLKKTASGHYSTSADVLERLRPLHPVIDLILEQRQLQKLLSTYIDPLPSMINPETGRLHTSYNQTGAETGRLSSSEPNLQNIPIRTELGREIRKAFVAAPGFKLLGSDYSQVELRILAHISGDPTMLAAFARGLDIHAHTASLIFGVSEDRVTPEQRRVAKMTNFAIAYGVTGYGLAQRTGLDQATATEFIEAYFRTYPKVKEYIEKTKEFARTHGYVETLLGRRRYFPQLLGSGRVSNNIRLAAERAAINHPIQGTAADIIKIAMINLHKALKERFPESAMILQVHDELVLEVPERDLDEVAKLVKQEMEGAYELKAPLKVDIEVGDNWKEMEKMKV